jgi:hypothetical protein
MLVLDFNLDIQLASGDYQWQPMTIMGNGNRRNHNAHVSGFIANGEHGQLDFAISIPSFMACIHQRGLSKTWVRL